MTAEPGRILRTKVINVSDIIKPASSTIPTWQHEKIFIEADRIRREEALNESIKEMREEMAKLNLELESQKNKRHYKKKPGRYQKKSNK
jgi:intergrase/recombinase